VASQGAPRQVAPRAERFEPSGEQWRPHRWTSELGPALVEALRTTLGTTAGERPAHRHGVVWTGRFIPSGGAAGLTDFVGFRGDGSKAIVRFSNLFRRPGDRDVAGMATKLMLADGDVTDLIAMSVDLFPVRTSARFLALLEALRGGPVRALPRVAALLATGRLSVRALVHAVVTVRQGRDIRRTTFHGVQTFRLVRTSATGGPPERRPVRYRWVPGDAGVPAGAAGASETDQLRFTLELVLGNPAWARVDDPTWRWPRRAPTVVAGELVLDEIVQPEPRDLAFNPAVLAPGIEPGDDDLMSDRAGAYAVAQAERRSGHEVDTSR
jgi:catalase